MRPDVNEIPRPEYPRPQFIRDEWQNLNGEWEFAFDDEDEGLRLGWHDGRSLDGRIVVPFPYQSALSGIDDRRVHERVWYARSFETPEAWRGRDLLLNFGAVDYRSTVWVNGQEVGHNQGGHVPFQFDIAPYVKRGVNRLTVRVVDEQDPGQPRGKQSTTGLPHDIDYYCWPESLLAAPSDEALQTDIGWAKAFGFNGVRKHQKIEDPRWLSWCDRLGLLVWEEMPNAREWSPPAEERLAAEWRRAVRRDYNHPCVVAWVPVNESMGFPGLGAHHPGQYAFIERMVADTRRIDPTRPIIDNDGWEHTDIADICAIHDYTPTAEGLRQRYRVRSEGGELPPTVWIGEKPLFSRGSKYRGQPVVLSEVGGFLMIPPNVPAEERDMLYRFYASVGTAEEMLAKYRDLMEGIASLKFLAGFCYTQLTDIEQEINGLLTYDRQPKVSAEALTEIHQELFRRLS